MTIQIPDDEMVKSVPPYMEESGDEEEESNATTADSLETQTQPIADCCPICNSGRNPESPKEPEHQPKNQPSSDDTDSVHSPTNSSDHCRENRSVGESTDMVSSETQCTCRPSATSGCSGEGESSQQCESSSTASELCEHFNGRIAPTAMSLQSQAAMETEMKPKCGCNFRRKSGGDVLDEEGMALFNILEFPSKVRIIVC